MLISVLVLLVCPLPVNKIYNQYGTHMRTSLEIIHALLIYVCITTLRLTPLPNPHLHIFNAAIHSAPPPPH